MQRAGFRCLAAIDFNTDAVTTLRQNLPDVPNVLERDLTTFSPKDLVPLISGQTIDVIVGGPPCQGFSHARRVDGSNYGVRMKADARRALYKEFLRYVDFFQPRVFVMENVLGLRWAAGGDYLTAVQREARELGKTAGKPGYRVHGQVEDSAQLGVPQKRHRQLIIGVRADLPGYFPHELLRANRARMRDVTLGEAIMDLPILRAGGGEDERDYDRGRRLSFLKEYGFNGRCYLYKVLEVAKAKKLMNHTARPHSDRDLRDFALLSEGESSAAAMRRGVKFEFPYDKSVFEDRFTRQSRFSRCSTIVAHLSKDGLMFIHPTQNRSITPREAARIQSFPDWFCFPAARTKSFRLIGNAVPPLISEAVGKTLAQFFSTPEENRPVTPYEAALRASSPPVEPQVPGSLASARERLGGLMRPTLRELRALPRDRFLSGWHALLWLFPELHPENALDHGKHRITEDSRIPEFSDRYARSGWPVSLVLIGREAWRRYRKGEIPDEAFYCAAAQRAGLESRRSIGLPASRT
jgi:DNA (cytosine-5)-methyltransferase 1